LAQLAKREWQIDAIAGIASTRH